MARYRTASSGMQLLRSCCREREVSGYRSCMQSRCKASGLQYRRNSALHTRAAPAASDNSETSTFGETPLSARGPYFSQVGSRGVISLDGPDAIKFLQGLVTNDVTRLERGPGSRIATPSPSSPAATTPPLYTALLNPQGRFLYDLFLYRPAHSVEQLDRSGSGPGEKHDDTPSLIADVDMTEVDELVSHLKRHRLRAKVNIENVSNDLKVWQRFGGHPIDASELDKGSQAGLIGWGGGSDESAQQTAESSGGSWRWFKDPRLAELGFRGVFPGNTTPPLVTVDETMGEEYYLLWRLEQGVAEGSREIPKGEAIPLEYNLAGLNAISFDKGCYIGQELVARTHHRGVIRKRLMPVNFVFEDDKEARQDVIPGMDVMDLDSSKKIGKVTTVLGPRGLALLRLDAAQRTSSKLKVDIPGKNILLKAIRPKWWPGEWGREEQQSTAAVA